MMSIATQCICGKTGGFCVGGEGCLQISPKLYRQIQPKEIERYLSNLPDKRVIDKYGWTGHYNLNVKDIVDMFIFFNTH